MRRSNQIDASRHAIARAAQVIRGGGVVAYPTESCFGLGCDPRDVSALQRVLRLKVRHWRQGLIVVAASGLQIRPLLVHDLDQDLWRQALSHWPGPVSCILPCRKSLSRFLTGQHGSLACRVSRHPTVIALCRMAGGAIVSTSANRHGSPPARSAAQVSAAFKDRVDLIIDQPLGLARKPSRIIDLQSGHTIRDNRVTNISKIQEPPSGTVINDRQSD